MHFYVLFHTLSTTHCSSSTLGLVAQRTHPLLSFFTTCNNTLSPPLSTMEITGFVHMLHTAQCCFSYLLPHFPSVLLYSSFMLLLCLMLQFYYLIKLWIWTPKHFTDSTCGSSCWDLILNQYCTLQLGTILFVNQSHILEALHAYPWLYELDFTLGWLLCSSFNTLRCAQEDQR